jgi:hypothetical protein
MGGTTKQQVVYQHRYAVKEASSVRSHDQAARKAFIAKCVLMLILVLAIGGWIWLLARAATTIAALL